jgi:amidohydrolase
MPTIKELDALKPAMIKWRHALHQKPEIAFEEEWTSDYIAERLESFGIEIHRGLAKTGIVGVVRGKIPGDRAIGLRADMDALEIEEANTFTHRSQHPGKMHACGHDGHSAMLLGAAKHLAENPDFAGTVYLIFQPAEENEGGARVMIEEGLFDRFSMEAVYGMHKRASTSSTSIFRARERTLRSHTPGSILLSCKQIWSTHCKRSVVETLIPWNRRCSVSPRSMAATRTTSSPTR